MAFELTQAYLELTGNALVRNLLSACVFDDKTRTFSVKESVDAITAKCATVTGGPTKEELRTARVQIMSFLTRLYYTCLHIRVDATASIPIEWWWEGWRGAGPPPAGHKAQRVGNVVSSSKTAHCVRHLGA